MILLPAWTIDYLQAWVYILTFGVSAILITMYLVKKDPKLLERRVKAVPTAETETSQKKITSLLNVFFIFVFIVAGFDYRFHWSNIPLYVSIIADVFVVVGFCIVFLVFKENSFTSGIIEVVEDQKVISTGPYRIVRHPMYAGALLMLFVSPIALGSYWAILCVIPLTLSVAARALDEEKFLSKNLSGYPEYCQKVHYRLIPLIW
ncbi:MAG TPA: isoprenylcysteine carboxylmethyltransferase family protein [Candidatus Lokiarchaeia archaeon]|nr:isoprenylcysteine carboxylmethyltransferase family protein [Candidatus Lokiarchaeia archaeon]